jgi:hypothetical protein
MTQREQKLLKVVLALGAVVLLGCGYMVVQSALDSLRDQDQLIARLEQEERTNKTRLLALAQKQKQVEQWQALSLPPDVNAAGGRYRVFLQDLCQRHQLTIKQLGGTGSRATGVGVRTAVLMTPLQYTLQAEGTLPRVIGFLYDFYSTNLPHQIREFTITSSSPGADAPLVLSLKVEAVSLPNAANRDSLIATPDPRLLAIDLVTAMKGGPTGLALIPWHAGPTGVVGSRKLASRVQPSRDYTRMVVKNVFAGLTPPRPVEKPVVKIEEKPPPTPPPPPPDKEVLKFVQLILISENFITVEALLRNRLTNEYYTLRDEGGFNTFTIRDARQQVVLQGKVKAIRPGRVVFMADDKHYALHTGEFLHDALRKALSEEDMKALGLAPANAAAPAAQPNAKAEPAAKVQEVSGGLTPPARRAEREP